MVGTGPGTPTLKEPKAVITATAGSKEKSTSGKKGKNKAKVGDDLDQALAELSLK